MRPFRKIITALFLIITGVNTLTALENISANVHIGNGILFPAAILSYDSLAIISMNSGSDVESTFPKALPHLTPELCDLNFSPMEDPAKTDQIMLSRGITSYLYRKEHLIYARHVGRVTADTLAACYMDLRNMSPLEYAAFFTGLHDNIRFLQGEDSPEALPVHSVFDRNCLSRILRGELRIWLAVDELLRARQMSALLNGPQLQLIVETTAGVREQGLFAGAAFLLDLAEAEDLMLGEMKDADPGMITDFSKDMLVRMPAFSSFWESLQYFSTDPQRHYTDEQLLSLYSIMAYPFFQPFFHNSLIEVDGPPNFVMFTTDPFSTRSLVIEVRDSGKKIYGK